MDFSVLADYGVNYEEGLGRCLGDQKFYAMLLSMFLEDDSFYRGKAAFDSGDDDSLMKCFHELKGVSGNAAAKELYSAVYPLVELLRGPNWTREQIAPLVAAVERAYDRARTGVLLALGRK